MLTLPMSSPFISADSSKMRSSCCRNSRTTGSSSSPLAVRATPFVLRLNSENPISFSSADTSWFTPEGVYRSASAAREKLPVSAAAKNALHRAVSIVLSSPFCYQLH